MKKTLRHVLLVLGFTSLMLLHSTNHSARISAAENVELEVAEVVEVEEIAEAEIDQLIDLVVPGCALVDFRIIRSRPKQPTSAKKRVKPKKINRLRLNPGDFYLDLHDESRLIGKLVDTPHLSLELSFGQLNFPVERIKTLQILDSSLQVKLILTNGDHLSGKLLQTQFRIATKFGEMIVPASDIKVLSIDVSNTTTHALYLNSANTKPAVRKPIRKPTTRPTRKVVNPTPPDSPNPFSE